MPNVGQMPPPPPSSTTTSPPAVVTTTPVSTTPQQVTTNNIHNNNSTPPPTTLAKNNSLTGPFIKKDKRQISSKFNTSPQQSVEIETLPPLKGRCAKNNDNFSIFNSRTVVQYFINI